MIKTPAFHAGYFFVPKNPLKQAWMDFWAQKNPEVPSGFLSLS